MTSVAIVAVFLLVAQFAYAAHVRSTVTMAAAEAARAGARVGAGEGDARDRALELMGPGAAGHSTIVAGRADDGGVAVMRVDITTQVPVLGPFGVGLDLHTSGRAVVEERAR